MQPRIQIEATYGEDPLVEQTYMTSTELVPVTAEPLTAEQADRESAEKFRRACNYQPIERPMELPVTISGVSILGLEIANATGMRPRKRPLGPVGRFWRRVVRL